MRERVPARRACLGQAGFTLLEIAVALSILGLVLVTMMQVISGGLTLEHKAGNLGRAVVKARALMDGLMTEIELRDGVEEGGDGTDIRWRRTVRPAAPDEGGPVEDPELEFEPEHTLRFLEVIVAWSEGGVEKTYTLQSLRVTPLLE